MGLFDFFRRRPTLEDCMAGEDRRALYAKLLESRLLLPTPGLGGQQLEPGAAVSFVTMNDSLGRRAMIAFTGEAALRAWQAEGCAHIVVPVRELARMALASNLEAVVVNPRGPVTRVVEKSALVALSKGRMPDDAVHER